MSYELDETQYAEYVALKTQAKPVYDLVDSIMKNKVGRRRMQEAIKAANPDAVIPEIDAAEPLNAALGKVEERLAAIDKRVADDAATREQERNLAALNSKWEKGRETLRGQGYTEDGIAAIEKVMETEGIANHVAGAAYYDRLNPPPEPVAPESKRFDIFSAPDKGDVMKLLHDGDDDGFLNQTIAQIRGEARATPRR